MKITIFLTLNLAMVPLNVIYANTTVYFFYFLVLFLFWSQSRYWSVFIELSLGPLPSLGLFCFVSVLSLALLSFV